MPSASSHPSSRGITVSNSTIIAHLSDEIQRSLRGFHEHSKTCRPCRNPVQAYQQSCDLCRTGRDLSIAITKLLYKKAEHVPNGTFQVEYKQGWTAVDGLIRIICHYNQGEFTTKIIDLKRHSAPLGTPNSMAMEVYDESAIPRGSMYEEDLRRRHRRRSLQSSASHLAVYGDPRVSYLDAPSARAQGEHGGYNDFTVSPASSNRSVHFDSQVQVHEFHT